MRGLLPVLGDRLLDQIMNGSLEVLAKVERTCVVVAMKFQKRLGLTTKLIETLAVSERNDGVHSTVNHEFRKEKLGDAVLGGELRFAQHPRRQEGI